MSFWLGAAAVAALAHVALAGRLDADEYWTTLTAAWLAVLYRLWTARAALASDARAPRGGRALLGVAAVLASIAPLLAREYRPIDRALPLVAGAGLALAAFGARGLVQRRNELALLALPLIDPPLLVVRRLFDPALTVATAWSTMLIHRAMGHDAVVSGSSVSLPGTTLDVLALCSGFLGITRLLVLAALLLALFPTTRRERAAIVASAVMIGFAVNAARIALLLDEARRGDEERFSYWHMGGGAALFSIAATLAAGLVWWWLLRPRRQAAAPSFVSPQT